MSSALKLSTPSPQPVLIIDKIGVIGEALGRHFAKENLVVLVSEKLLAKESENILHIPFKKNIPEAPDNLYSKIFIVDDGSSVTKESAFSFINKAMEGNSPLYFLGSIRNVDVEHADDVVKAYENAKVLIFGDLFDKNIYFDKESSISKFILSARKKQKIEVEGDGLALNFPISFVDTIKLIIKATELEISQKVVLLFSQHPITDISLANLFRKVEPALKIDYIKKSAKKDLYIPQGALHALEKYDLEKRIKEISLFSGGQEKIVRQSSGERRRLGSILLLLALSIFIVFLPAMTTGFFSALGDFQLNNANEAAKSGNIGSSLDSAKDSSLFFQIANKTGGVLEKELLAIGQGPRADKLQDDLLQKGQYSSGITHILSGLSSLQHNLGGNSLTSTDVKTSTDQIKEGIQLVQRLEAENPKISGLSTFQKAGPWENLLLNSEDSLFALLGFNQAKNYLVVYQNPNIPRPGGGVIEKAKLLALQNGKVLSFSDVDLPGLKSDSPFFLRRYAKLESADFRNSAYSLDSPSDARRIIDTYSSKKVDGLIFLPLNFERNLNMRSLLQLAENSGDKIKTKDIRVNTTDPNLQNVLLAEGWSGALTDTRQTKTGNINDWWGFSEADLGGEVSKISRTGSVKIRLDEKGKIQSVQTLVIKNGGSNNYKNYLQAIIPPKSELTQIKIDGKEKDIVDAVTDPAVYEAKKFKAPSGLEVNIDEKKGYSLVGFLVNFPAGAIKTVSLSYSLPYLITKSDKTFNYSLNFYKQPGIDPYPVDFKISFPDNYQLTSGKSQQTVELDSDKNLSAQISQK